MPASWKGVISFGLVEIPAELQRVEESAGTSATMLDKNDLSPVGYRRYNKKTGKEVEWSDIVSGYEYEKGQYVVLTDEEREAAHPRTTRTIEILEFVDIDEIEPLYFERPYYVKPGAGSGKAYLALRDVLRKTAKAAISQIVLHTRQHLAAVVPRDDLLVLHLLRYSHEIREAPALDSGKGTSKIADTKVTPAELKMAEELVESMSGEWKPEKYRDTYRDELVKLVEMKANEGKVHSIEEGGEVREGGTRVLDLMEALKKSVEANSPKGAAGGESRSAEKKSSGRTRPQPARRRREKKQKAS